MVVDKIINKLSIDLDVEHSLYLEISEFHKHDRLQFIGMSSKRPP